MNIYSDGQSRVLNGAFPKRFRLLSGDREIPYLRTGDESIRITGEIPVGELLVQEIIREKAMRPQERPVIPQIVMVDKKEIEKVEKASVDLEETSKVISDRADDLERIAVVLTDREDKNAEAINEMDGAVSQIVENIQKEIESTSKQSAEIKRSLVKMIGERAEDLSDSLVAHENANNPHRITKATIGLDKVENISPDDMPISKATKKALEKKADKDDLKELQGKIEENSKSQERIVKGVERMNLMGGVGGNELPSGGKAGQVLAKKSNKTGDYEWVSNAEGSVTDVKVDGTSIVNNGVAQIPNASGSTYGVVKLTNSLLSISNTLAATPSAINTLYRDVITGANTFDKDLTYNVGDKVRYSTGYYECITAITTAHAWNASEWQQITIQDEIDGKIGYGTSTTAAATVQKEVTISTIKTLNVGQLIIVTPTATSTVANSTIKLNDFPAYPMLYGGNAITTSTDSYVWIKDVPGWWLFDGSNWLFAGHGYDINTTYNSTTLAVMIAGENTTNRLIAPATLKDGTFGVVTAYASGDTITPADKYLYNSTSNISALTIAAPSSPDERYMAQINMSSGSTATTFSYPPAFKIMEGCDDVQYVQGIRTFVPVENKRYQVFIENDGVNTILWAKGV